MAIVKKKTAAAPAAAEKKEAPVAKTAAKANRKAPAPKVALKIQYMGKEFTQEDLVAAVQAACQELTIKTMDLYVKPEDNAVYYVINGDVTGKVEL